MSLPTDELAWMEDLAREEVRRFIEDSNREVESLLGEKAKLHYERLLEYAKKPRVVKAILVRGGVVALYKGLRDSAYILRRDGSREKVYEAGEGEIITGVTRVQGRDDLIAVHSSLHGRDEGVVRVINVSKGEEVARLEGLIRDLAFYRGRLLAIRSYRREKPPDGGGVPTDRVVDLSSDPESVVWGPGYIGEGEFSSLYLDKPSNILMVSIHKGWSRSRLLYLEKLESEPRLVEEGDYLIKILGWREGPVYLRKRRGGDELVVEGRVARFDRPVEHSRLEGDMLLVVDIVDSRSRVRVLRLPELKEEYRQPREEYYSVSSVDSLNGSFLLVKTGFDSPYKITVLERGSEALLEEGDRLEDLYVSDVWVSNGGVKVHGFILKGRKAGRGVVLYGYGGFGVSLTPFYSALFHHLIKLGYTIIVANLRGGGEEGEEWHRQGMLRNKVNVFRDFASFIDLAKSMGAKTVAYGISNGGLLVGAVETMWPELLDAAVIGYPVLDMLRYHKLYVGKYWVPEYGDPEDPGMREYLLSYSPYHNIPRDKRMPPTLIITGLEDDRVHPAHALKYAAKARKLGHRVLLRVETRSGHSGALMTIRALESAYIVAFIEEALHGRLANREPLH